MFIETRQLTSKFASLILAVLVAGGEARGDITITIEQSGNNVVETGSGAVTTTGLIYVEPAGLGAEIGSDGAIAVVGDGTTVTEQEYRGMTGPANFGSLTSAVNADAGTGAIFGIDGSGGQLLLPSGYGSDTQLSGSATFDATNFTSLGLTAGTYTYTWGTGPDQSLTVQIGPAAAAVPEPSTAILAVVGAIAFVTYGWTLQRRQQRRQVSA